MDNWILIILGTGLGVNALIVAFGYGTLFQRVKGLENGTTANTKQVADNRHDIESKLASQSHIILPECQSAFGALNSSLSEIKGKVDMLILLITELKK